MIGTRTGQRGVHTEVAQRKRGALNARRTSAHPQHALFAGGARPLRFALTGALAGLFQLGLLALLTGRGWPAVPANAVAFLLAAQVNFALSSLFTWRDRRLPASPWRRWLLFHGSIAAMAVLNGLVFLATHTVLPALAASAAGIAVAALGNFVLGDRLVFRALPAPSQPSREAA